MRAITVVVSVVVSWLGAGAAYADEAGVARAEAPTGLHVALGINSPIGMVGGGSRGASLYVGFAEHHAIRANVAHYAYEGSTAGALLGIAAGGDGDEPLHGGHTTDVGIGWVYYPGSAWSGWTLELGVLRRERDHRLDDENATPELVVTQTTTYAGRAMVGWTWVIHKQVFVAVAAGISVGREAGTEASARSAEDMTVRTKVSRSDASGEGLLRLGVAFDL